MRLGVHFNLQGQKLFFIHVSGADPGFLERGSNNVLYSQAGVDTGGGVTAPVTARGSGGAL